MLTLVQTTLKLNSNYKSTIFKKYIFVLVMIPRVLEIVSCHKWKRILDCCLKRDKKIKPLKNQKSEFFEQYGVFKIASIYLNETIMRTVLWAAPAQYDTEDDHNHDSDSEHTHNIEGVVVGLPGMSERKN